MRRAIALAGVVAAALATAVGAAGCGGGGGLDGSAVAQAAQATRSARTAQVSMTVGVAGQSLSGGGYVDLKGHAADMSLSLPQGTIREIFKGTKLYLQVPSSLRKAAAAKGVSSQGIDTLIKELGHSTIPVDVWLDNQKRLRRERFALSVQGQTASVTFELFNFGTSHAVTPPPADQTADITNAASQQQP
jgi:hypothetical protein